jgi:hypothetical protein
MSNVWDEEETPLKILLPGGSRGRSPHKFTYTYQDIASTAGLSLQTVWKYARTKKFDPKSLESVVSFIIKRKK